MSQTRDSAPAPAPNRGKPCRAVSSSYVPPTTAPLPQLAMSTHRVLSFDAGIRHLALALVQCPRVVPWPPECRAYATPDESREAFDLRALQFFLAHGGWEVLHWRVLDASTALTERAAPVRKVKALGPVAMTRAIVGTLQALPADTAADLHTVAVEAQHNGNPVMRGVAMAIFGYYLVAAPAAALESVSGRYKLHVCDALGIPAGAGNGVTKSGKARKRSSSAAAAAAPARAKRLQYEDNKHRAILALAQLFPGGHAALAAAGAEKKDDMADALLQALWTLWTLVAPKPPRRAAKRKRKDGAAA